MKLLHLDRAAEGAAPATRAFALSDGWLCQRYSAHPRPRPSGPLQQRSNLLRRFVLAPPYRIEAGCDRRPCLSHLKPPSMAVSPNALCLRSASSRASNTVLISDFSSLL